MHLVPPSEEFIISDMRPRRAYIAFFLRWYTVIIAFFVTTILCLTVVPYAPWVGVVAIVIYWTYYILRRWIPQSVKIGREYHTKNWHFVRALFLVLGVTLLLVCLYLGTDFLLARGMDHTLWLLLLLATLVVSQGGTTQQVAIVSACAVMSLIVTTAIAVRIAGVELITVNAALDLMAKISWLLLLALIFHLFIRFVGDLFADVRLLHEVTNEMLEQEQKMISESTWTDASKMLQQMVTRIASDYGYADVNYLHCTSDGSLQFMAASSAGGQELVRSGFKLSNGPSVLLKAAATKHPVLANDTQNDPDYRSDIHFSRTRSELAIPVIRHEQLFGVLDIEAHYSQAFLDHDVEVMGIFAGQLARAIDNMRAHEWRRKSGAIIQSIACRLLSESELGGTLQEIADSAQELLDADIVVLYERNPATSVVSGPIWSGQLTYPRLMGGTRDHKNGLLARLLADTCSAYYHSDTRGNPPDPLFRPAPYARDSNRPSFEEREGVQARATLRLAVGHESVGIMFVNFRHPQEFPPLFRERASVFANLAALAIHHVQLSERELELQRKELAGQVHDHFGAVSRHAAKGINLVLEHGALDSGDRERLSGCKEALDEMLRDIRFLHSTLEDVDQRPFSAEAEIIASRIRTIYGIEVVVDWQRCSDSLLARYAPQCKLILDELAINAILHGGASTITLRCMNDDEKVVLEVKDNGRGFDQTRIRPSGLNHVRERAIRLGGTSVIETSPGCGTCVTVMLPLTEEAE
jgi:signal transduction histidine kinase